MCRHVAYLGPPVRLGTVLVEPAYALYRQAWAPRQQEHGTVNADGFGVGWYAPGDPVPARYRRAGPMWADPSFTDLARVVRSGSILAAVRDTTDGSAPDASAAAPYGEGRWLFSHNGALPGWPGSVAALAGRLPAEELLNLEARCDSALVWALVLHRLRDGASPGEALADTVTEVAARVPARLNLLLTDGETIAATAWGDTLWHRWERGSHVVVASEPYDDAPGWTRVPDRTVILARPDGIDATPLKEPPV
ncbi:ergothioneine biosynthesis protein EgtC [Streptantibioticus silvisoli]|uniref:Gamma-glutamyl-hercynylcysteine sulfoxide hydrolase n=1 Tax=Streptantibioticus silvisoli TaxID=2705255 RepID=A0ABT6W5D8_9ACTN|nr:ergothioneine biosynthesis protein EgtC [Streptantibioticus silvisoli]MDI5965889.1 ergothioneine biosynthesis protein EgtC [Streptantibioticus silvisoli]